MSKDNFENFGKTLNILDDRPLLSSQALLKKLANYWAKRAVVKKDELEFELFSPAILDFSETLLPFCEHPLYQAQRPELKSQILSCAWIAYNEKTIALETMIVNPLCVDILYRKLPGISDEISKRIISEIMTDESYHVLMVVNSTRITREYRNLDFTLGSLNLVKHMHKEQSLFSTYWQKCIIQFVTAIVAEIFTSASMATLSSDKEIQPLHQKTVYAHYIDETAHGSLFKELAKLFYAALDKKEKEFFIGNLIKPSRWLADAELDNWKIMFDSIGFTNNREIIEDCKHNYRLKCETMDYKNIFQLAEEIGIKKDCIEKLL